MLYFWIHLISKIMLIKSIFHQNTLKKNRENFNKNKKILTNIDVFKLCRIF
jgi:hypothetical protein